ncbi:MAG: aminotransferase class I/II-fold pyridoxal phosphate-dependent enzyme, partial [Prochlorothrix sp.]
MDCQPLRSWLETGALVVVDEAFLDFLPQGDRHSCIPWLAQFPNLVVIRSLTKFYSVPGLRLGYALGHPDRLRRWQQWRDPWSVNSLAAAVGTVVVQDRDFQAKTWAWLPPARDRLFQGLHSIPGLVPYPGAVNFLLVHCEAGATVARSVLDLQAKLLCQHRILIRDCLSFP